MLKNINPIVEPELLFTLAKMGHGDEIVFSDIHFPAIPVATTFYKLEGVKFLS